MQEIADLFTGLIGADMVDAEGLTVALQAAIKKMQELLGTPPDLQTWSDSFQTAFKKMADGFASTMAIITSAVQQTANFISEEFIIALDPSSAEDGPSAQERFKAFLGQLGKMIIAELAKWAIAKAIFSLAGGVSGGGPISSAARGGQIGFDDGGTVPGGKHEAKQFRPAAIALSDTVPAWLTPGEFVNPVRSVLKYGADLFEGLRTGALDPAALREAAGLTNRRKSVRKVRARGFAEGGTIGDAARAGERVLSREIGARGENAVASPALMVSDDQQMDRIMAGGQRAFRAWAENEKEFFRGIVRE